MLQLYRWAKNSTDIVGVLVWELCSDRVTRLIRDRWLAECRRLKMKCDRAGQYCSSDSAISCDITILRGKSQPLARTVFDDVVLTSARRLRLPLLRLPGLFTTMSDDFSIRWMRTTVQNQTMTWNRNRIIAILTSHDCPSNMSKMMFKQLPGHRIVNSCSKIKNTLGKRNSTIPIFQPWEPRRGLKTIMAMRPCLAKLQLSTGRLVPAQYLPVELKKTCKSTRMQL